MEKLSRVKKYEDLRKSIELDNNIDETDTLKESVETKEALKSFDSSILKKVEVGKELAEPKRAKEDEALSNVQAATVDDTFTNEYLDDFIKEVRDYNIRKGNRECEDTEVDILYQLNAVNRAKRAHYVQEIQDPKPVLEEDNKTILSKEEIALEVQNLLKEEDQMSIDTSDSSAPTYEDMILSPFGIPNQKQEEVEDLVQEVAQLDAAEQTIVEDIPEDITREMPVKKVIMPGIADFEDEEEKDDPKEEIVNEGVHRKLIEETQQLRVQLDEYEEELTDLSSGVEKNNKLLNFILCFLILVLLVVVGFIVYTLWKAGGIKL